MNRMGYGAMQLAGPGVWGPPADPDAARRVLRLAVELGVTFFDTANAYGPRTVNQLIGEALRPFPEGLIVGNKVGAVRGPERSWEVDGRPETVRRQVLESLADLGVQHSELTYLRLAGDNQAKALEVPIEESLGVLTELRDQGLIRRIGLSGADPAQLARAQRVTPIFAVQNRYNVLDRSGGQVLDECAAQGILFVPYFPLAAGQLADHPELTGPAGRLGVTPAQIALAWLLRRSPAIVAIPGTADPERLRANVAAAELAEALTEADYQAISAASAIVDSQAR